MSEFDIVEGPPPRGPVSRRGGASALACGGPFPERGVMAMGLRIWIVGLAFAVTYSCRAQPLPKGPGRFELPNGAEPITVFTYKPPTYKDGPLLVVCHGVGRNAEEYRDYAITLARRFGVMVVAPLFDKERFPSERYQHGGLLDAEGRVQESEQWTFSVIPRLIDYVRGREGRPALHYYLIGHSAGGQFLVRLTAFLPTEAGRIVAANPGSHLVPTRDEKYRYGFGGLPPEQSSDDVIRRYLAAPLTIYLGTGDVLLENSIDLSPEAMRQGPNRLERGRACFAAAQRIAQDRGWTFNWRLVETPGIGHEAALMFAAPEVGVALFGKK
jgi:dienelactone hydrolase